MEHDLTQPISPPRDRIQWLLRLLVNGLGYTITFLWLPTFIATIVLPIVFPSALIIAEYLFRIFLCLSALIFVRMVIIGVVLMHAPRRISPKLLNVVARRTSRPRRYGELYLWCGVWISAYFGAALIFFPWGLHVYTIPPSLIAIGAALPIVIITAFGPMVWHRVSERQRRRATALL